MIPFHFAYYRPETWQEAVKLYQDLLANDQNPMYYSGGTEIITLARMNEIAPQAVIDIKDIPECKVLSATNGELTIGSAQTLTAIAESKLFPLLGATCQRIADHSVQGKITLGGNLAGTIIYREAVLPLLVSESRVVIAGQDGLRTAPLGEVFDQRLKFSPQEFLVQIITDYELINTTYYHEKITTFEKIDYPLVTIVLIKKDNALRTAFSGLCEFPFRSVSVENELNNRSISLDERITNACNVLPAQVINDLHGSSEYRIFVLKNALTQGITTLEES